MPLGLGQGVSISRWKYGSKAAGGGGNGGITPDELNNLVLWLKADTGCLDASLDPCDDDTDNVLKWEDQSGEGNDFEADNPGVAPFFGMNRLNSLPSVIFQGTDQTMKCASSVLSVGDKTFTVFVVAYIAVEQDDDSDVYALLGSAEGAYGNIHLMWAHDERTGHENKCLFGAQATSGKRIEAANWMANHYGNFRLYTFRMRGADIGDQVVRWNGGDDVYNTVGSCTGICDPAKVHWLAYEGGTSTYAKIELTEFIIYSGALSDTEMGQIESYLGTRFDLNIAS